MPFAVFPRDILRLLDLSLPQVALGKKENAPSLWRTLNDHLAGRTTRLQPRTLDAIYRHAFGENGPTADEVMEALPERGYPWEMEMAAYSFFRQRKDPEYKPSEDVFRITALGMERLYIDAAEKCRNANDLAVAVEHISRWDMCDLPSLQWALGGVDTSSHERFTATVMPLAITANLYLMACCWVEIFGPNPPNNAVSLMPLDRNGKLIRPMTRWMESLKAIKEFSTFNDLYDFLLSPGTGDEDPQSLRREARRWRSTGGIPAWRRIPRIANSIATHENLDVREVRFEVYALFAFMRFVDKLLTISLEVRSRWLPDYDPLALFGEGRLIYERAVAAKLALSPQVEQ